MSRAKKTVGRRAVDDYVSEGMTLGLGTGSTVYHALVRLAERVKNEGLRVRGVPTSVDTETKALQMGIPLVRLEETQDLDLTIDGADEINPALDLIKGGGGALLREKVVASVSRRLVIIADRSKLVETLGRRFRLPVEIVPFARPVVVGALRKLGAAPGLRLSEDGSSYLTDNGNEILDCSFTEGIGDPASIESRLAAIPGVVESGLFVGMADVAVLGDEDGDCEIVERE